MERWLRRQQSRFALACDYHHVVFTVPHELLGLWRFNRVRFGNLLFRAAGDALLTLLQDDRYLGAEPGLVLSLHTWGRSGIEHVHVHALVTAGGWSETGWRGCPPNFFVPYKALRRQYRDRLLALLRRESGGLVLPGGVGAPEMLAALDALSVRNWHVRVMDRYRQGRGVLIYFSRYVRGGPLANDQIRRYTLGQVTFRYQDHAAGAVRTLTLSADEFIRRLLEHVPEKGFRVVRYYGLFAASHRGDLAACREALGMGPDEPPPVLTLEDYLATFHVEVLTRCPTCGRPLRAEIIVPVPPSSSRASPQTERHAA
jgi:hypothetical protein